MTRATFTPDEIRAAEIEAAREEGFADGMRHAAYICRRRHVGDNNREDMEARRCSEAILAAIEAKAKEAR